MPSSSSNIEIFNLICLQLFSELYDSFPVPIAVDPNALAASAIPKDSSLDGSWSAMDISRETISFLEQENFLTVGGRVISGDCFDVRLTMKGLAVLGSVPVTLKPNEPREPLIAKIGKLMGKGAEKIATETVQAVVSEIFKFALSSGSVVAGGMLSA